MGPCRFRLSAPTDNCESTKFSTASGPCTPVLGELTVYLDEEELVSVIEEAKIAVLRLVEFAMDNEALSDVDPTIKQVVFLPDPGTSSPTPQPRVVKSSDGTERIRGFPAIITFAVLFLLLGLFMIWWGIKRIRDDEDSLSKDRSYGGYVEEQEERIQTEFEDDAFPGDDDGGADVEDGVWPEPASGANSDQSNGVLGDFSPADGTFERDVGGDWGTPESSVKL